MIAPSSPRLLAALQRSLATLQDDPAAPASADAALRWIHHNSDETFHSDHYLTGRELLQEGLARLEGDAAVTLRREADSHPVTLKGRRAEEMADPIARLGASLERVTGQILASDDTRGDHAAGYLQQVEEWERAYYAHLSGALPADPAAASAPQLDAGAVQAYLRRSVEGAADLVVTEARILTGGFGRATVLVAVDRPVFGTRELVIRAELPISILTLEGLDITTEFEVLRLAYLAGVAVPEALLLEADENETRTRFIVMRKAHGANYGSFLGSTEQISEKLIDNLVAGLAQIHAIDVTQFPEQVAESHLHEWIEDVTISDAIRRWLDLWHTYWRSTGVPSPLVARAFRWLEENQPQSSEPPRLMHSDYGLGNLLIENDEVTAVLDWEATHLGDPAEEVAWLVSNLRGQVDEDEIVNRYATETGLRFEPARLRYWDVMTAAKILVCGFAALAKFRDNAVAGPSFCLLASQILEPYCIAVQREIERAETARGATHGTR
jgi:aminoglycoside phosphotransferase (APT) family kinase protein